MCIGSRLAGYPNWIWVKNMTCFNKEIHLLALDLHLTRAEYVLEVWFAPTDLITLLALGMKRTCAGSELQTCLGQNQVIRFRQPELRLICAEYGLEIWRTPSDEIRLMAINLQTICSENCLETRLLTSDEIRKFTIDMQFNCAIYGLQTWLCPTQRSRVLALDLSVMNKTGNMTRSKWWSSCIFIGHTAYLCWICAPNVTCANTTIWLEGGGCGGQCSWRVAPWTEEFYLALHGHFLQNAQDPEFYF